MIEKLGRIGEVAARRLHVRSALNPMLWLTAIGAPMCFFGAYIFNERPWIPELLIIVGIAPIILACLGFAYFAIWNPGKLQSEDYQIRHESLQIIQQKTGVIGIPVASLEQIVNPALGAIEHKGGEK